MSQAMTRNHATHAAPPATPQPKAVVPAVPAATLLMVRDGTDGIEVLMVVRAREVDFASGAMVFPGGKMMASDAPEALGARLRGSDNFDAQAAMLRVAALREGFEEMGILPAHTQDGAPACDADVLPIDLFRKDIDRGRMPFAEALKRGNLFIDISPLEVFAHIITPEMSPKRFDTWFYLCPAPAGQTARPDGNEVQETHWITAREAMARGRDGRATIMLPTEMVLARLAEFPNVAAALAGARAVPAGAILPRPEKRGDMMGLVTDAVAGFPAFWEPYSRLAARAQQHAKFLNIQPAD